MSEDLRNEPDDYEPDGFDSDEIEVTDDEWEAANGQCILTDQPLGTCPCPRHGGA